MSIISIRVFILPLSGLGSSNQFSQPIIRDLKLFFQIGSPVETLQKMSVKIYMAAICLNITLYFKWNSRNEQIANCLHRKQGPWLDFDDFSLDSETISEVKSRGVNLDEFASFHNKFVKIYFLSGIPSGKQWNKLLCKDLFLSDTIFNSYLLLNVPQCPPARQLFQI